MTVPVITPAVQRIIAAAERAGLTARWDDRPHRGSIELHLTKRGPDFTYGRVRVGLRTGRVLYASLVGGKYGPRQAWETGRVCGHMLRALNDLPAGTADRVTA